MTFSGVQNRTGIGPRFSAMPLVGMYITQMSGACDWSMRPEDTSPSLRRLLTDVRYVRVSGSDRESSCSPKQVLKTQS